MAVKINFDDLCRNYNYQKLSLEELVKQGENVLGKVFFIESHSRSYKGVLSYIFSDREQIWFEQASIADTDTPIFSILCLFFSDIVQIAASGEVKAKIRQRILREIHSDKRTTAKPIYINPQDEDSEISLFRIEEYIPEDPTQESIDARIPFSPLPAPYAGMHRPSSYSIVDNLQLFQEAMAEIEEEFTIGVSAQEGFKGREDSLIWLAIATSKNVFLIDLLAISIKAVLHAGLQRLLMDENTTKIILRGAYLEDYFHHQYGFGLQKVAIPELMDLYLNLHEGKEMPSLYKDFLLLLRQNLGIKKEHVPHLYSNATQELEWNTRPLPGMLCLHLFESVFLLRELYQALINCLLMPLDKLSEMHLASMREKDTYGAEMHDETIVPLAIQESRGTILNYLQKVSALSTVSNSLNKKKKK